MPVAGRFRPAVDLGGSSDRLVGGSTVTELSPLVARWNLALDARPAAESLNLRKRILWGLS